MLVDVQPQYELKGWVDRLVEEVGGLERKRAEEVDKLVDKVAKVAKEVVEVTKEVAEVDKEAVKVTERMKVLAKSLTLLLDVADENVHEERNVNVGNVRNGCSYKKIMTCKTKEFDAMGGVVAYIHWVEKMESVQDMSGCGDHQKIRGMVAATDPPIMQNAILKSRVLTDEAMRNGALKRNGGESSKEGNVKGENKRARTGKDCKVGTRMVNPLNARNPTAARGACFECGGTDHYKSACPRLNRAQLQRGNHPNQAMAIEGGQGRENNYNSEHGRAFVMGAEEARQGPNTETWLVHFNNKTLASLSLFQPLRWVSGHLPMHTMTAAGTLSTPPSPHHHEIFTTPPSSISPLPSLTSHATITLILTTADAPSPRHNHHTTTFIPTSRHQHHLCHLHRSTPPRHHHRHHHNQNHQGCIGFAQPPPRVRLAATTPQGIGVFGSGFISFRGRLVGCVTTIRVRLV
nr:reverse transcriptase domain-containing protein [Tanacetum cinerariifolium]